MNNSQSVTYANLKSKVLDNFFSSDHSLPPSEMKIVSRNLKMKSYNKGDYILKKDKIETKLSYILNGIVHQYILEDTNEVTINLAIAGMTFNSFISYTFETPSDQIQRAMTNVNLVYIEKHQVEKLLNICPKFCYVTLKKFEEVHAKREVRAFILQQKSARRRIELFIESEPKAKEYFQMVPQKYIASYIGLSQEAFSRAKGQYLNTNFIS